MGDNWRTNEPEVGQLGWVKYCGMEWAEVMGECVIVDGEKRWSSEATMMEWSQCRWKPITTPEEQRLRKRVEELEQWRNGCLPTCPGNDGTKCGCGYLQGQAYRELRAEVERLREGIRRHREKVKTIGEEYKVPKADAELWRLIETEAGGAGE